MFGIISSESQNTDEAEKEKKTKTIPILQPLGGNFDWDAKMFHVTETFVWFLSYNSTIIVQLYSSNMRDTLQNLYETI